MKTFDQNCSDYEIIKVLCQLRAKRADQRNEAQYFGRLIGHYRHRRTDDELDGLLPPREVWAEFRPPRRLKIDDVDFVSVLHATLTLRNTHPRLPWVIRLHAFIHRVQQRVQNVAFKFSTPEVRWEHKAGHKYRAIAMFNLEDNVICSLTAKYLKEFIDPAFETSSYAFRAAGVEGKTMTYHDAFEKIYEIRKLAGAKKLYVAECDIRGFYDSVDHGVALTAYLRVVNEVERSDPGRRIDPRAAWIFGAYLDCYSFPQNILGEARNRLKAKMGVAADFPWPVDELKKHHRNPLLARIGVPQGGAISCLIANLVLDLADKRIKSIRRNVPGLNYLRYCDDMVLIAPTKSECSLAFTAYLNALNELKLPYHPAKTVKIYGKEFWSDDSKSKAPYCWAPKTKRSYVPWVQFVGYQIRYDGLVRVKPKSVKKQIDAMKGFVDKVKWGLLAISRPFPRPNDEPPILATESQAGNSVTSKLTAMGVGRVDSENPQFSPLPMCWTNGFKALQGKPIVPTFLKKLDRERERQIRRFKRAPIVYGPGRASRGGRNWQNPEGYLFSYHAQFTNHGGQNLIQNP